METNSLTLRYDGSEDRILVAINAGQPNVSGYWLTRRLTLNLLQAAAPYLDRMSPMVSKTPMALHAELAAMEREVALATTEKAVSVMPHNAVETARSGAELAFELTLSKTELGHAITFRGVRGGHGTFACSRAELQRVIHMMEREAVNAGWREAVHPVPPSTETATRLAN